MTEVEKYYGDAWCAYCKVKVDFEGDIKVSDSGRRMAQGKCSVCGAKVNRILGKQGRTEPKVEEQVTPEKPYAEITITYENFNWVARVTDYRRRMNSVELFYCNSRKKALAKAREWIDSYEVIKLYKEN